MFRMAGAGLLLIAATAAAAEGVPRFDIETLCRSAPRLEPTDPNPYQGCVRDETEARSQLERQWASFDAAQREECVRATDVGGAPSFVDVLTCIQMAAGTPPSVPRRSRQGP
jgi:hypothetical protein